ncbi:pilus assembly protein TadG-related protein [Nocardioides sp.]|uniref:pilus assembly protein TadG-related protein n=1 Tax=Nocardioides sp. TaxID=35761 RepID=UPI00261F4F64|nr:pilus assembly protein TadG-related protein [Nocardioides sp.]
MRRERGSTIPLIIGFTVILLLAAVVVIDATAAWLQRQSLDNVADGAALYAADAAAEGREVYTDGLGSTLRLDPAVARRAVHEYVVTSGARERYPDLTVGVRIEGNRVRVDVRARLDLPLRLPGGPRSPVVSGHGAALTQVDGLGD